MHEILAWCREQGFSDETAQWLITHEEELIDMNSQEIDELVYRLERMVHA